MPIDITFLKTYWSGRTARADGALEIGLLHMGWALLVGVAVGSLNATIAAPLGVLATLVVAAPLSRVLVRRAHDIGWPAVLPVAVYVVAAVPVLMLCDFFAQGPLSRALGVDFGVLMLPLLGTLFIASLLNFCLMTIPGQKNTNKYGRVPASWLKVS